MLEGVAGGAGSAGAKGPGEPRESEEKVVFREGVPEALKPSDDSRDEDQRDCRRVTPRVKESHESPKIK